MSKYTPEQILEIAERLKGWGVILSNTGNPETDNDAGKIAVILQEYAALLREREAAKAAVMDEITMLARRVVFDAGEQIEWETMRAALEAVAPMLANAQQKEEPLAWNCKIGHKEWTGECAYCALQLPEKTLANAREKKEPVQPLLPKGKQS